MWAVLCTQVCRSEILHSLLYSDWSVRHYLEDIAATSATGIGRVRGLFNDVCRCLLEVLQVQTRRDLVQKMPSTQDSMRY